MVYSDSDVRFGCFYCNARNATASKGFQGAVVGIFDTEDAGKDMRSLLQKASECVDQLRVRWLKPVRKNF